MFQVKQLSCILEGMAERNLKPTIITLLQQHHLLSSKDILTQLAKTGKKYNKTSVYRSLDQLIEDGQVCKLHLAEKEAVFELKEHHHVHLLCAQCGKIESADCTYQQPSELKGFKVDHHHVTLIGRCRECQN